MVKPKDPFVMFVSSVEGHLVARYGAGPHALIGARHGENGPEWTPEIVCPLTDVEVATYGREYRRAISEGALKERKREDFDAYVKAENDTAKKYEADQKAKLEAALPAITAAGSEGAEKLKAFAETASPAAPFKSKAADAAREGK
jgi:hypothetical protein